MTIKDGHGQGWQLAHNNKPVAKFYRDKRDCWIGVFIDVHHVYICILPTLVIRWKR